VVSNVPTSAPLLGEPLPVELMNTVWADRSGTHEALDTAADAVSWISAISGRPDVEIAGLGAWVEDASTDALAVIHTDLRRLRDASRDLAARRTHDPRGIAAESRLEGDAVATVNSLAATAPVWPILTWANDADPQRGLGNASSPGQVLVAEIARETIRLLAEAGGNPLRACLAPGCVLYFVQDHPRREWCSPTCGNRARQARHYQRRHQPS
jgi:predicted RNA-binding Zn ribbon-like protein